MALDENKVDDPMNGQAEPTEETKAGAMNKNGVDAAAQTNEANPNAEAEPSAPSPEALLEDALSKRDEYLQMAQRIQAEFENYKRRNQSVRAEAWEDGARETIALMLPVMDNLERALDASKEKTPLRDGLELIHKQMMELLEKRGVSVINRLGEPFEPELENAVAQADPSEGAPGTVCTVLLKGYKTASRVIRYAMVRVVAGD